MKLALVHDSLIEFGGGERVLQTLIKIFPTADIYSSYAKSSVLQNFPTITKINLSFLQKTPIVGHNTVLQILSPIVWKSFNFEKYDLVISISSYALCNLINPKKAIHVQYILSPPKNLFGLSPKRSIQKIIPYTSIISSFYHKALLSSNYIITDSIHIQKNMYKLFHIKSRVIYPPVRIPKILPLKGKPQYFITVSRLEDTKGIDLIIRAFNKLKLPLKIIGQATNPKYERYLKFLAGPTVDFLGRKSDEEIDELYKSAIAFISAAENEDFGIAPVEAMAHGVPVIAYYGGGLKETIIPYKTGIFFYNYNSNSLKKAIQNFSDKIFNAEFLYNYAQRFSEKNFSVNMLNYLSSIINRKRL